MLAWHAARVSANGSKQVVKTRDNAKGRTHAVVIRPKDDERRVMIKDRMSNAVNTVRKTRS